MNFEKTKKAETKKMIVNKMTETMPTHLFRKSTGFPMNPIKMPRKTTLIINIENQGVMSSIYSLAPANEMKRVATKNAMKRFIQ